MKWTITRGIARVIKKNKKRLKRGGIFYSKYTSLTNYRLPEQYNCNITRYFIRKSHYNVQNINY